MKQLSIIILALFFSITSISFSIAGIANCKIESIEGSQVVLDCGKKAGKFTVGKKVKISTKKKPKVEGC
jgi:hypothetical protein